MSRQSFILLLGAVLAGIGYAFYSQFSTQARLDWQLQQLSHVLTVQNEVAAKNAGYTLEGLKAAVLKNHNFPPDVAALAKAEALAVRADSLASVLGRYRTALLLASRNQAEANVLAHPNESQASGKLLGPNSNLNQFLHQQVAAFVAAAALVSPTASRPLTVPAFDNLPVVAALAALTQLESDIRASELDLLDEIGQHVGAERPIEKLVAVASSESNSVAPGHTYRARLYLVKNLISSHISMSCNGRPVPVGADGVGRVRFTAPRKPGPAEWLASVRLNMNGRDSTFRLLVPYRVANH